MSSDAKTKAREAFRAFARALREPDTSAMASAESPTVRPTARVVAEQLVGGLTHARDSGAGVTWVAAIETALTRLETLAPAAPVAPHRKHG